MKIIQPGGQRWNQKRNKKISKQTKMKTQLIKTYRIKIKKCQVGSP